MPRALAILVFLNLMGEDTGTYGGLVTTPLAYVDALLFQPSPLKFPLSTYALVVVLVALGGAGAAPRMRARPMVKALLVSVATIVLWIAIGAVRGGRVDQSGFQTFPFLNGVVLAFALMAAARTPAHHSLLLKAIVAAATFRAAMGVGLYVFVVRKMRWNEAPEFLTAHQDSVLFVTALIILITGALERATPGARRAAWILVPLILAGIQVNNRRLAWVSLLFGLVAAFAAYPPGRIKRRIVRAAMCVAPVVLIYMAVGWGRPESVFKPLRSLSSVGSRDDSSTRSRDNENDGLIFTLAANGALGTGFGHEYIETDTSLSARNFAQYRYIPHNSVLGLLAFTGALGIAGILLPLPISVFLNARTARAARAPPERVAAVTGVAAIAICLNQMYGDMGFGSRTTVTVLAIAFAAAGRLSTWTGAWPGGPRKIQ
ncbi:MAG: O-antigen ligase family protein [Minicystis sp.]